MFARKLSFLLLLSSFSTASYAQRPDSTPVTLSRADTKVTVEEIALNVGEQRVIPSNNVRSYSEGTKGIVDVRLTKDASQFVLVGGKPGATTVLFINIDGSERHLKITVSDPNATQTPGATSTGGVAIRDNIRLDFYFVQVSKNYSHRIGIGWPGAISAPTLSATYDLKTGALGSATAFLSNQPLPKLDMAQNSGWAKVMREVAVITANGEKALFSGGGEVNVMMQSALSTGIQKIPFGSVLEVSPVYDSSTGRIDLSVHADISELESDRGTGVPGRVTATLDTLVNIELGQSLVLAGLTARSERRSKSGLPLLSQIPILGALFGTHAQDEEETENVIIIVPSVVDAVTMSDRARIQSALKTFEEYSGDLDEVSLVPQAKSPSAASPSAQARKK
jgi:pilus assembly protein CpaC